MAPTAAPTGPPRSSSSLDLLEAPPAHPPAHPAPQQTRTSHSHHPSYAQFALQRLDEATLRRLNSPPALPASPLAPPQQQQAPLGQVLREALANGQKVAMPILLFMAVGCCHLIGWGLLVYGTFAVASASAQQASLLPALGGGGGGSLLGEADAKGLGFLLYMASVVACGVWLHGYILQKRRALQQQQQGVRSPGPMGA